MFKSSVIFSAVLFSTIVISTVPASALSASRAHEVMLPSDLANVPAGSLVIRARQFELDYVLGGGRAIRYPIAVPKSGKGWSGTAHVNGKFEHPAWAPPAMVKRDHPELPDLIPGGASNNPMGIAALTLDRDQIAIHGTTRTMRASIGTAASYGCIRMLNEDVADLYSRVQVGALVLMIP